MARAAGLGVNLQFGGHGVGRTMHGDPHIANDGRPGRGFPLQPGLVIAIEPWFLHTTDEIYTDPDGWTLRSADGSRGAHMEHTVAITEDGPLVLTARTGPPGVPPAGGKISTPEPHFHCPAAGCRTTVASSVQRGRPMTGSIRGRWLRTRTFVAVASGAVVLATGAATERRTPSSSRRPNPRAPGPGAPPANCRRVRRPRRGRRRRTGGPAPHREQGRPHPRRRVFRRALEDDAQLEYDGTTGTVRILQNLDGYLTGPSTLSAQQVVLRYLREHHAALGLTEGDLATFRLSRNYQDVAGIRHLSWTQEIGGGSVFGNGLQAAVTADGRLLMLGGSPVSTPRSRPPGVRGSAPPRAPSRPPAATPVRRRWRPGRETPPNACSS